MIFALVGAWVVYLFLNHLGTSPLENWDEAFYADGIRAMVRSHNFIIPSWNQAVFVDKPPLYYWLGSISVSLFGLSEWAIRLPSVLAAIITVYLCGWYMWRRFGIVPALVTLMVLISNGLYIYRSRGANLDAVATLWIVVSFLLIQQKSRYMPIWFGLCIGLLYLTKASLSYYLIPIFIAHTLNSYMYHKPINEYAKFVLVQITLFFISAAVLPILWLASAYYANGLSFVSYFLFSSDQGTARLSLSHMNLSYLGYMRESVGVWFGFVAIGGYLMMMRDIRKYLTTLLYGTVLFAMLSFSKVYANWYLLPVFPFVAIEAGYAAKQLLEKCVRSKSQALSISISCLVVSGVLLQHVRLYNRIIRPVFINHSTSNQKLTAEYAQRITRADESIVRLDDLYPAAIYYSDRKVIVSKKNADYTNHMYITRDTLVKRMGTSGLRVILGKSDDITRVFEKFGRGTIVYKSGDEAVGVIE